MSIASNLRCHVTVSITRISIETRSDFGISATFRTLIFGSSLFRHRNRLRKDDTYSDELDRQKMETVN